MSKVYIISAVKAGMKPGQTSIVLELPSSQDWKNAFRIIKNQLPKASLGVFGARDLAKFQDTQRKSKNSRLVYSISEFVNSVGLPKIKRVI